MESAIFVKVIMVGLRMLELVNVLVHKINLLTSKEVASVKNARTLFLDVNSARELISNQLLESSRKLATIMACQTIKESMSNALKKARGW